MDRLLRRMAPADRASFTAAQIAALSRIVAARYAAPEVLDWRQRIRIGRRAWHVVLRIGRDN